MTPVVLLVDDSAVQAATRRAVLARAGYQVSVEISAPNALKAFESHEYQDSIGLVITDHLMPRMNGPEFIAALRRQAPALPVLVLSGLFEAEREYEGLDVVFRIKPLPPEELIALVGDLLDGSTRLSA